MKYEHLSDTISFKTISENDKEGIFEIEGLYTGYGVTVGNALRRVLLSSLPGAAITQFKIKGVSHEFATLPGMVEDMVEVMLNLKRIRFRMHTSEPQNLTLKYKGEGKIAASEIKTNAQVEVVNPDAHIATLSDKSAELDVELTVEEGLGYVAAEARKSEKLPIGVIALDAIFSPVIKVNVSVENMRVEDRTDYNRLRLSLTTDGTITPSLALKRSAKILQDHFSKLSDIEAKEIASVEVKEVETKERKKRATKAKKKE